MSKVLQRELESLRERLVAQFTVVEQMTHMAVRSLVQRRPDFADRVMESDAAVDQTDIEIEEECLKILALHQPVAGDMRWLIAVIKVNGELERMADTACNIAERAKALARFPLFQVPEELSEMVDAAIGMVRRALDSFVNSDSDMAADVIQMDDLVDTLNRVIIDQLHEVMKKNPELIEPAVHCFSASRHLERIADLAENLAEEVIYLVDGEIVRHQHGVKRHSAGK
ncbi:phosphate signaling complex protein PhoU [Roseiconus nitratireducens]|uniref:Phosphate-specific transport system accessory protein PhoU n=1 Tax=Roseiconus nitratireducens TaxID=2605748 RepID=A0A5M6D524_9BACT|nr:phosphate signaling complex protein PhoU [Roseiconus nitratireducens]KAA5541412.1 phosphate signaling complex protein PhoU [Roseiconus nitratireducens]